MSLLNSIQNIVGYSVIPKERSRNLNLDRIINTATQRNEYLALLNSFSQFIPYLKEVPIKKRVDEIGSCWENGWFPALDSISLYSLIALRKPSIYLEVGSGVSTTFARRAVDDHKLPTKIVSIDPKPRLDIDSLCDTIHRKRLQDLPTEIFTRLPGDALILIDGSHKAFQNSDVAVFFLELLPVLSSGVMWGLHDIFLPFDYPQEWFDRGYNEQYLLASYLLGGKIRDRIVLPNWLVTHDDTLTPQVIKTLFSDEYFNEVNKIGSCFWFERQ